MTARGELFAVRRKGEGQDVLRMPFQHADDLSGGRVPEMDVPVLVPSCRGDELAVRRERQRLDRAPRPLNDAEFLTPCQVPHLDDVVTGRGQRLAVRRQGHAVTEGPIASSPWKRDLLARGGVPDAKRTVTSGDQRLAVQGEQDGLDQAPFPDETAEFLAGGHFPQSRRVVAAA